MNLSLCLAISLPARLQRWWHTLTTCLGTGGGGEHACMHGCSHAASPCRAATPCASPPTPMPPTDLHATMLSLGCACPCYSAHTREVQQEFQALFQVGGFGVLCMALAIALCASCMWDSLTAAAAITTAGTVARDLLPLLPPLSACFVPAPPHPLPLLAPCPPGACCCSSRRCCFWRSFPASCSHRCSSGSACHSVWVGAPPPAPAPAAALPAACPWMHAAMRLLSLLLLLILGPKAICGLLLPTAAIFRVLSCCRGGAFFCGAEHRDCGGGGRRLQPGGL
jgi:hypothetical protein